MLIYIRIPETLKARVDELVSRGQYSDLSAVVAVALENLMLAEQEHTGLAKPPVDRADEVKSAAPAKVTRSKPVKEDPSVRTESSRPAIFNWTEPPAISEKLIVPLPADLFRPGQ